MQQQSTIRRRQERADVNQTEERIEHPCRWEEPSHPVLLLIMKHRHSLTPSLLRLTLIGFSHRFFTLRTRAARLVVKRRQRPGRWLVLICSALIDVGILTGCTPVGVHQQRLVSKRSMLFSESAIFNYSSKVLTQVESGAAATGGAQAAGCTSCR